VTCRIRAMPLAETGTRSVEVRHGGVTAIARVLADDDIRGMGTWRYWRQQPVTAAWALEIGEVDKRVNALRDGCIGGGSHALHLSKDRAVKSWGFQRFLG
jgi:hypothetical protein